MKLDLDIHNFYEHLVLEHLETNEFNQKYDQEFIADLCCLALTRLPARYIRHDIDMAFFLSNNERAAMSKEVQDAIDVSLLYLEKRHSQ
jgi:hypothetical protein